MYLYLYLCLYLFQLPKFWSILDEHNKNFVNVRPIQNNGFRKVYHRKPLIRFKYFAWQK